MIMSQHEKPSRGACPCLVISKYSNSQVKTMNKNCIKQIHVDNELITQYFLYLSATAQKGHNSTYTIRIEVLAHDQNQAQFLQIQVYTCFRTGGNSFEEEVKSLLFLFNGQKQALKGHNEKHYKLPRQENDPNEKDIDMNLTNIMKKTQG